MNIELLQPADGSVTEPLQRHPWPEEPARELAAGQAPADDAAALEQLDRSCPRPVLLTWRLADEPEAAAEFDVEVWQAEGLDRPRMIRGLKDFRLELTNLLLGTSYCWKVTARAGRREAVSAVGRFTTHAAPPRWIAVPGVTNVRDIGGWPLEGGGIIRQGMVYRSSEMDSHHQITEAGRRVLEDELGVRTDLDLRGVSEPAAAVLDDGRVEWINVPVLPYQYIREPIVSAGYRRIFQVFAEAARYPILVHCWGGADRTGTVAFLLGALLGEAESLLALDYELTSLSIWGARSRHSDEYASLRQTLARQSRAGDLRTQVEEYLRSIGVTAGQIASIRELLVAKG